jgi:hypothetical protein
MLTQQMRAGGDAPEQQAQAAIVERMRDTGNPDPVPHEWVAAQRALTKRDVETDPEWLFAPIAVTSHMERHALNAAQAVRFGKYFNLPVIRWRLKICGPKSILAGLSDAELAELADQEPGMWGYFVQGAPAMLTENINTSKGLVNGTMGTLHSLSLRNVDDTAALRRASAAAAGGVIITLPAPPVSVNVAVADRGGFPAHCDQGHRREIICRLPPPEDEPNCPARVVIPVLVGSFTATRHKCVSEAAAAMGLFGVKTEQRLVLRDHGVHLAFALTDFKMQGQTLKKIILSLGLKPHPQRQWDMAGLYVCVSRVRRSDCIRTLRPPVGTNFYYLCKLKHDKTLHVWKEGYTDGLWDPRLAAQVAEIRRVEAKRPYLGDAKTDRILAGQAADATRKRRAASEREAWAQATRAADLAAGVELLLAWRTPELQPTATGVPAAGHSGVAQRGGAASRPGRGAMAAALAQRDRLEKLTKMQLRCIITALDASRLPPSSGAGGGKPAHVAAADTLISQWAARGYPDPSAPEQPAAELPPPPPPPPRPLLGRGGRGGGRHPINRGVAAPSLPQPPALLPLPRLPLQQPSIATSYAHNGANSSRAGAARGGGSHSCNNSDPCFFI